MSYQFSIICLIVGLSFVINLEAKNHHHHRQHHRGVARDLTADDITLIRKGWAAVMTEPEEHGVIILKTFLDKYDYYNKFERFKDEDRATITENPIFRNHAKKIVLTLDKAIANLDNLDALVPLLTGLGQNHAKRKIKFQQFQELKGVIMDILKSAFNISPEEVQAWENMFAVALPIIEKVVMDLTAEEIELIRVSWAPVITKPEDHGALILKTFLDKHNYYYKFERFKDADRDSITDNAIFRNHAKKLMVTIDKVIESLDRPHLLLPLLTALGEGHAKRKIQILQFEQLQVVVVDILRTVFHINNVELQAWLKLFNLILPMVANGLSNLQA